MSRIEVATGHGNAGSVTNVGSGDVHPSSVRPLPGQMRSSPAVGVAFVVGLPRSGTTLLAYLLAGCRQSLSLSEPYLAHAIFNERRLARFFRHAKGKTRLAEFPQPAPAMSRDGMLDYLIGVAAANGLPHLILKETYRLGGNWDNVALMNWIAAGGHPVVAIARHPYDIAVSSIRFTRWWRGPIGHFLRLWAPGLPLFADDAEVAEYVGLNWAAYAEWCVQHRLSVVRYEDLVADPAARLPGICDQLRVPFEPAMLDHNAPRGPFGGIGDPGVLNKPSRPVTDSSVGRKHLLAPKLCEIIARLCANQAVAMGYSM